MSRRLLLVLPLAAALLAVTFGCSHEPSSPPPLRKESKEKPKESKEKGGGPLVNPPRDKDTDLEKEKR